jgi:hypothetical protein
MSLESRLKDMGKQVGKLINEGAEFFEEAPPDIIEKRRTVCENCPIDALITNTENPNFWTCDKCGCFYREKSKYISQSCPESFW